MACQRVFRLVASLEELNSMSTQILLSSPSRDTINVALLPQSNNRKLVIMFQPAITGSISHDVLVVIQDTFWSTSEILTPYLKIIRIWRKLLFLYAYNNIASINQRYQGIASTKYWGRQIFESCSLSPYVVVLPQHVFHCWCSWSRYQPLKLLNLLRRNYHLLSTVIRALQC